MHFVNYSEKRYVYVPGKKQHIIIIKNIEPHINHRIYLYKLNRPVIT